LGFCFGKHVYRSFVQTGPRFVAFCAALLFVIAVVPGVATGTPSSIDARSTGDGFVRRLRQTHSCDLSTKRGFIAGGDSYLASCASNDGSFRFIAVVQAKPDGLTARSSYIEGLVNDVCKDDGGVVFTAGLRKHFFAMYLGRGKGIQVAGELWQGLAEQLTTTDGHFTTGEKCAQGQITEKMAPTPTQPSG
jgi:hypothetical protein